MEVEANFLASFGQFWFECLGSPQYVQRPLARRYHSRSSLSIIFAPVSGGFGGGCVSVLVLV